MNFVFLVLSAATATHLSPKNLPLCSQKCADVVHMVRSSFPPYLPEVCDILARGLLRLQSRATAREALTPDDVRLLHLQRQVIELFASASRYLLTRRHQAKEAIPPPAPGSH